MRDVVQVEDGVIFLLILVVKGVVRLGGGDEFSDEINDGVRTGAKFTDDFERGSRLTFVVVGGGFTGEGDGEVDGAERLSKERDVLAEVQAEDEVDDAYGKEPERESR